jgi:putative ABC transport system permease protein
VLLTGIAQDVRLALRGLRKAPGFAASAVIMLALAIGANTAVFSVIDKVLVRPLPIADADRLVIIWPRERANPTTIGEISHWTFRSWQQQARSFETLAGIGSVNWSMVLREHGEPATIPIAAVSASFFPLVRTPAALGRTLLPEDDRRGAAHVAVMSHGCWVRRFGADPHIVGRRLMLDGEAYTVVGVMPDGFDYPRAAELWVPVVPRLIDASTPRLDALESPWFGVLFVLGRLHDGVTIDQARAEVSGLIERNAGNVFSPGSEAVLTPIREQIFGKTRPALLAIGASVGLVLLIACANVATLLLIRSAARNHETGIRVAVGASQWRIVRQSLTDALVLSILGGLVGALLARWLVSGLVLLAPADVPRLDDVRFDSRTLVFAWVACLAAAVLGGIFPGLYAMRANVADVLRRGGARLTQSRTIRRGFVVVQVSLAVLLLVGAGLVGRSFINLRHLDLGFNPTNLLTLDVTVEDLTPERSTAFYTALMDRVRGLPGAEVVGAIFLRPLEHTAIGLDASIILEGQSLDPKYREWEKNPGVNYEAITPDYFRAVGMSLLRGRFFNRSDTDRAPQVVIISEGLARRLWPGQNALGKRLHRPGTPRDANGQPLWSTVVGVVENARYRGLTDVRFDLYVPYLQRPEDAVKHLMVRTSTDPLSLAPMIRAEALRIEPTALVEGVRTVETMVDRAMAPWRFSASTLGLLSVLAFLLATIGVYTIVRETTLERVREIAVRMAIGALPRDIVRLVLREGLWVVGIGTAVGALVSMSTSHLLTGLLFGVQPVDPLILGGMAAIFILVAMLAMILPARRATRVDPLAALRYE